MSERSFFTRGAAATVSYRTGVATLGTVTQTVSLSGNLAPDGETDLDFAGAGKVTAVNVQSGQTVTAGQVLATQDPTTVDASLTQAEATLASAQANLTQAEAGTSASNLVQAEAQVNSSYVAYQNAVTSLADTKAVNAQMVAQAYSAYTSAQAAVTAARLHRRRHHPAVSAGRGRDDPGISGVAGGRGQEHPGR